MDPITVAVVTILGKYALDKGLELGKEVGPKALDTAKEMWGMVLERIGKKKPETAAEFPTDPETYQRPLEKALDEEVQADPGLAGQLETLLEKYEEAAREHAAAVGKTYQATLKGSGALAQDRSAAASRGGIAAGRDVRGDVRTFARREDEDE